jgi:riboflavin-specific deaminase-like protein
VVGQLGQSLDGRIATPTGDSRYINGTAALDHLHGIRALSDAVVVGVGTVIADDPLLTVRRVPGNSPARIVIDPRGRVPLGARCFERNGVRLLLVRAAPGPVPAGCDEIVIGADGEGRLDPQAILRALRAEGFRRLLIEGGAGTISAFMDADALDRLHLLVGQVIIGSGTPGVALRPIALLKEARRPKVTTHLLADGDVLFDCDLRSQTDSGDA